MTQTLTFIMLFFVLIYGNMFVIRVTIPQIKGKVIAPYYTPDAFKIPENIKRKQALKKRKRRIPLASIKLPIIMYHYVEYVSDPNDSIKKSLSISPYLFNLQMKALSDAKYEMYFVKDVPKMLSGDLKIGSRSAILTFDDGYKDFYSVVLPVLQKYNLKATLYVIVDYIGRDGFLDKNEIQQLIESGLVEIGSHTLSHVYLKNMKKEFAEHQLIESKKQLENMFHISIQSFAYPFGAFSEESVEFVKNATYSAAVSVIPGHTQSADNLFFMSRLRAGNLIPSILDKQLQDWEGYFPKEWK